MRNLSSLKQEFLRKWIKGLRKYNSQKKNMNLLERKKAIKLSADLAMASTRNKATLWRKALVAKTSIDESNKNDISTSSQPKKIRKKLTNSSPLCRKRRRIRTVYKAKERVEASFIAKKMVQKRTRKLKSLLPGGKSMDEACLVDETLDYIESLRAQVEVMRCLVTASELFINPSPPVDGGKWCFYTYMKTMYRGKHIYLSLSIYIYLHKMKTSTQNVAGLNNRKKIKSYMN
ncbi:transcription factor IBH1-like 1 isoform X2 [Cicer arietinum]|uniref:transcription factor IBH1-like 1 isoform X2 n=1 Tax=Cicer arietinum TaxID=3827 RepID=UPI003CC673F7